MNRIAEENAARRNQSFDTVLPDQVRFQFTRPKRPRVSSPLEPPDRNTLWLAVAIVLGAIILAIGMGRAGRNETPQLVAVREPVQAANTASRSELAVAPRATLLKLPPPRAVLVRLPQWRIGGERLVMMPYGLEVVARLKGRLPSTDSLPISGNAIGDAWSVGDSLWVWVAAPGSGSPNWIDP
jgi:hypothetical protein